MEEDQCNLVKILATFSFCLLKNDLWRTLLIYLILFFLDLSQVLILTSHAWGTKLSLIVPPPHIKESLHGITSALQNEFCVWTTYPQKKPSCYAWIHPGYSWVHWSYSNADCYALIILALFTLDNQSNHILVTVASQLQWVLPCLYAYTHTTMNACCFQWGWGYYAPGT